MDVAKLLWDKPRRELARSTGGRTAEDDAHLAIEMSPFESSFLCGLLREKRPAKIVEVGVSAGGTSALMLKAAAMLDLDCTLHSIDVFHQYVRDESKPMGYVVDQYVPELAAKQILHLGKVSSVPLATIGDGVDFCILDTQHIMPGEVLDFLAVFPYLAPGAVVVLHDMQRQFDPDHGTNFHRFATSALFSCVAAEKLVMADPNDKLRPEGLPNISAFKINADTRKHIANVFMALTIPWSYLPTRDQVGDYFKGMIKFYEPDLLDYFKRAVNINLRMRRVSPFYSVALGKNQPVLFNSFS